MPNLVTKCVDAVALIENRMAPLIEQKKAEYAAVHRSINSCLGLWCEQFEGMHIPHFDGQRGIGFRDGIKDVIYESEAIKELLLDGGSAIVTFSNGVFPEDDFEITIPIRYLDEEYGVSTMLEDAQAIKSEYVNTVNQGLSVLN